MSDLIKRADALSCLHLDYKDVIYIDKRETAKRINAIKTVDAVSVVRCKECKRWGTDDCFMCNECQRNPYPTKPDDFCSYGGKDQ